MSSRTRDTIPGGREMVGVIDGVTEIVGVQAYDKPYIVEGTKIYNTLILKHANLIREYKILYVSLSTFLV